MSALYEIGLALGRRFKWLRRVRWENIVIVACVVLAWGVGLLAVWLVATGLEP